jgi:hypothetical protein
MYEKTNKHCPSCLDWRREPVLRCGCFRSCCRKSSPPSARTWNGFPLPLACGGGWSYSQLIALCKQAVSSLAHRPWEALGWATGFLWGQNNSQMVSAAGSHLPRASLSFSLKKGERLPGSSRRIWSKTGWNSPACLHTHYGCLETGL